MSLQGIQDILSGNVNDFLSINTQAKDVLSNINELTKVFQSDLNEVAKDIDDIVAIVRRLETYMIIAMVVFIIFFILSILFLLLTKRKLIYREFHDLFKHKQKHHHDSHYKK